MYLQKNLIYDINIEFSNSFQLNFVKKKTINPPENVSNIEKSIQKINNKYKEQKR